MDTVQTRQQLISETLDALLLQQHRLAHAQIERQDEKDPMGLRGFLAGFFGLAAATGLVVYLVKLVG